MKQNDARMVFNDMMQYNGTNMTALAGMCIERGFPPYLGPGMDVHGTPPEYAAAAKLLREMADALDEPKGDKIRDDCIQAAIRELQQFFGEPIAPVDMPDYINRLRGVAVDFASHPEGCTCPNNGGGDCEWCLIKSREGS